MMLDCVSGHRGPADMTRKINHHREPLPCRGLMPRTAGKAVSGSPWLPVQTQGPVEGARERFILDESRPTFLMRPVRLFLQGPLPRAGRSVSPPPTSRPPEKSPLPPADVGVLLAPRAPSPHSSQVSRYPGLEDTRGARGTEHQHTGSWRQRAESVCLCTEHGHRSKE